MYIQEESIGHIGERGYRLWLGDPMLNVFQQRSIKRIVEMMRCRLGAVDAKALCLYIIH